MVKVGFDNSITLQKGDRNEVIFRTLTHFENEEVDRVIFNITDNREEIKRENLEFKNGRIFLNINANDLKEGIYKYNLKICLKGDRQITVIKEKMLIVQGETIKCY